MTDKQNEKLANVHKKIETLLEDNKKGRITIYVREDGSINAEVQEEI